LVDWLNTEKTNKDRFFLIFVGNDANYILSLAQFCGFSGGQPDPVLWSRFRRHIMRLVRKWCPILRWRGKSKSRSSVSRISSQFG